MCSKNKDISLGFTNKRFQPGIHMCLLYRDETERREIISKYLQAGIQDNEKIDYFADIMTPEELQGWLKELGIELPKDPINSQVTISPAVDVYCPHGTFVTNDMLQVLRDCYDGSIEKGYSGARVTGETTWTTTDIPGIEHFIEYEAMINDAIKKHPVTVMCQYDVSRFDGGALFDILQVHPLMVVHGQIVNNPAYIGPKVFLEELYTRKKA